jgi:hypothetical protein
MNNHKADYTVKGSGASKIYKCTCFYRCLYIIHRMKCKLLRYLLEVRQVQYCICFYLYNCSSVHFVPFICIPPSLHESLDWATCLCTISFQDQFKQFRRLKAKYLRIHTILIFIEIFLTVCIE